MLGTSSLKSVSRMVTVAVADSELESVATTSKTYSSMASRSKMADSKTIRISVLLRKPKILLISRGPGSVRFAPIATVNSSGKESNSCRNNIC